MRKAEPIALTSPAVLRTAVLASLGLVLTACAPVASRGGHAEAPAAFERPASVVEAVEPWTFYGRPGKAITTPGFRVYTTLDDGVLLRRVPRFLELALEHYTRDLADLPRPAARMETYVMANRPQWAEVTQRLTGARASQYLKIRYGGFADDKVGVYFDIGAHNTLAIAAHEGWHQYTQTTFRTRLPAWLEEGIASYMEGFRWDSADPHLPLFLPWANVERFDALQRAHAEGRLFSLDEIVNNRPQDLLGGSDTATLTYYAQAWALVHFLNEGLGGRLSGALREIVTDAASGRLPARLAETVGAREARASLSNRRGDALLRAYVTENIAGLGEAYQRFVAEIVRTGGRDAIVAGVSPVTGSVAGPVIP